MEYNTRAYSIRGDGWHDDRRAWIFNEDGLFIITETEKCDTAVAKVRKLYLERKIEVARIFAERAEDTLWDFGEKDSFKRHSLVKLLCEILDHTPIITTALINWKNVIFALGCGDSHVFHIAEAGDIQRLTYDPKSDNWESFYDKFYGCVAECSITSGFNFSKIGVQPLSKTAYVAMDVVSPFSRLFMCDNRLGKTITENDVSELGKLKSEEEIRKKFARHSEQFSNMDISAIIIDVENQPKVVKRPALSLVTP